MPKLPVLALAFVATSLSGAEFSGGVQFGLAVPFRDLQSQVDADPGMNLGLLGQWDLQDGHSFRVRLSRSSFSKSRSIQVEPGVIAAGTFQGGIGSLQMDYIYYAGGRLAEGLYLGGGLGMGQVQAKVRHLRFESPSGQSVQDDTSQSARRPIFSLVMGYQWAARWNLELAYQRIKSTFRDSFTPSDDSFFAAVSLDVGFTFGR